MVFILNFNTPEVVDYSNTAEVVDYSLYYTLVDYPTKQQAYDFLGET